jgi:hypothetical protein
MKKILPILTLALLGATATVSAADPYTETTFLANTTYTEKYDKLLDTTSTAYNKNGTYNFGSYVVTFEGYSRLKIHANENINLYVYDFVDNVLSGDNSESALNGKNPVKQIGYREIDSSGNPVAGGDSDIHPLGAPTDSEVVQMNYEGPEKERYDVVRNSYHLGEFKANKDYELYVEYTTPIEDNRPWSYTGWGGGILSDNDTLMAAYCAGSFDSISDEAVAKSYIYSTLVQANSISFGLRSGTAPAGGTSGQPLPGGLQIALIAGLFGLGFYYVRRRKAMVA